MSVFFNPPQDWNNHEANAFIDVFRAMNYRTNYDLPYESLHRFDNRMYTEESYSYILYQRTLTLLFKSFVCFYVFGLRDLLQLWYFRRNSTSSFP